MTFSDLYIESGQVCDKGRQESQMGHDYINSFYSDEFTPIRKQKLNIVEIGIHRGDSLILFRDWFLHSNITGIDDKSEMNNYDVRVVNKIEGINVIWGDAYSEDVLEQFENESIDYLIEDGSHKIEHQLKCIELWFSKIKKGGTLIIEDIQNFDENESKFDELGIPYNIIDTRDNRPMARKDDVLLIFRK